MAANCNFATNGSKVKLAGDITFDNVAQVRVQGRKLIKSHSNLHFDFSGVKRSDSAALALLVVWSEFARKHKKTIYFDNLPAGIIMIANLYRVASLLPIVG